LWYTVPDMVDHSVGVAGDVLAHCNKCELDLWHTVVAKESGLIKRVKCNTCKTEHGLRGEAKLASHKRSAGKATMAQVIRVQNRVPHKPWGELITGRDAAEAVAYSVKAALAKNGLVQHPAFGLGIVTDVSGDKTKATVLFESGEKVLAANRP
jgi:hypothetical protein